MKHITIYALYNNEAQVSYNNRETGIFLGCSAYDSDVKPIKTFNTLEEALEELKKHKSFVKHSGHTYFVHEWYVSEIDQFVDNDGDPTGFGNEVNTWFAEFDEENSAEKDGWDYQV